MGPAKKTARSSAAAKTRSSRTTATSTSPSKSNARVSTGARTTGNSLDNTVRNDAALRWLTCHTLLNYALGEQVSYARLGAMLAQEFPWRKRPYDQAVTYRIGTGERAIRLEDVVAFVRVLKRHGIAVDPGWLAFGDETAAPAPDPEHVNLARLALAED